MATAPTAKRTPKQRRGDYFEKLAADKLSQAGLTIITTNYDAYTDGKKLGEIDIIATHSVTQRGRTLDYLVFIEVRSRRAGDYGGAVMSINHVKQSKIMRAAEQFYAAHPVYTDYACRFDVYAFDIMADGSVADEWLMGVFGV